MQFPGQAQIAVGALDPPFSWVISGSEYKCLRHASWVYRQDPWPLFYGDFCCGRKGG
jgi:hypothetical protein